LRNDRSPLQKLRNSLSGLREGWIRDRAFRGHVLFSVAILIGLWIAQPALPWILACIVLLVTGMAAELINNSIEVLLDQLHPERHAAIGAAKDMASAAAFAIHALAAVLFACAILTRLLR